MEWQPRVCSVAWRWGSRAIAGAGSRPCFLCHPRDRDTWANTGAPGLWAGLNALVHSTDVFFILNFVFKFLFFYIYSFVVVVLLGVNYDIRARQEPNRKLNLRFAFDFAPGLCKWTAKLMSNQKFLLNPRPSGKCSSTVCSRLLFWKKPNQNNSPQHIKNPM